MTIVAGPNGSGKSSLTFLSRAKFQQFPLLDPDAIAKSLQGAVSASISGIEAGKDVLRQAERHIQGKQSFTVETTLSGGTYLKMALTAKDAGFHLVVIFVGTASVEINLERVKARVKKGGHDVPEEDQRRRFPRSMANLQKLAPMADLLMVFDNSTVTGHKLVAYGRIGSTELEEPLPDWAAFLRG